MPRSSASAPSPKCVSWEGGLDDGRVVIVDRSDSTAHTLKARDLDGVCQALRARTVATTNAIAVVAAYGVILHLIPRATAATGKGSSVLGRHFEEASVRLTTACPRDVLVQLAVERLRACYKRHLGHLTAIEMCARLLMEAKRIQREHDGLGAKKGA
ncbi:MAG: hypothetical protein AAB263_17565 [Planctomycetota bacterium]